MIAARSSPWTSNTTGGARSISASDAIHSNLAGRACRINVRFLPDSLAAATVMFAIARMYGRAT